MTKAELTRALWLAHGALAMSIACHHRDLCRARRALRSYPHLEYYQTARKLAADAHEEAKHTAACWLPTSDLRAVRTRAAEFIRAELLSSRRLNPRAFPARPAPAPAPVALAA